MPALTRDILFRFKGDTAALSTSLGTAGTKMNQLSATFKTTGASMRKVGGSMTKAALPLVAALGFGVKSLVENEKLLAQTDAVIESMGGAANVTKDEVLDLANAISGVSGMAHESILEGENMLLTFGNIKNEVGEGNDIFNQTTRIMADMSLAMGTKPKDAAIQLGKALNDPVLGVSALSRVGIQFTEDQKDLMKTLVDSGDTMGAQKIILAELEKQFGGSAAAAGQTMGGKMNILKNNAEAASRSLAQALMPSLELISKGLATAVAWFNNLSPGMKKVIGVIVLVVAAAGPLVWIIGALATAIGFLLSPIGLVILAVAALGVGLFLLWQKSETFRDIVLGVWEAIKVAVEVVVFYFQNVLLPILSGIWENAKTMFTGLQTHIEIVWDTISGVVDGAIQVIQGIWDTFKALFTGDWEGVWNGIKDVFTGIWRIIRSTVTGVWDAISNLIRTGLDILKNVWDTAWGLMGETVTTVWRAIIDVIRGVLNGILSALESGVNFAIRGLNKAIDLADKIAGPFVNFPDNPVRRISISRLATGGDITRSGVAIVGEEGPEPVFLPAGSRVLPNSALGTKTSPVHIHFHIEGRSAQTDRQLVNMILDQAARQAKHAGRFGAGR